MGKKMNRIVNKDHKKHSVLNRSRRSLIGITTSLLVISSSQITKADLISELIEKSASNKEINNKKVLATSYANFARSRTVTDKTCAFPDNFLACQNRAELGQVKFLTEDVKIE